MRAEIFIFLFFVAAKAISRQKVRQQTLTFADAAPSTNVRGAGAQTHLYTGSYKRLQEVGGQPGARQTEGSAGSRMGGAARRQTAAEGARPAKAT